MHIIKIEPYENGAHDNQNVNGVIPLPKGYAIIPEDVDIPHTYPFVFIDVENDVVTSMTANQEAYEKALEAYEKALEEHPEPVEPETDDVTWDSMAEAITEGVNEV